MLIHALDIATSAGILYVVALGLLVIFGVLKIINLAHSAFLVIGGYVAVVATQLHFSLWYAIPVSFILGIVIGAIIETIVLRPLYARPLDTILATWGISIVVVQIITLIFGRETQFATSPITGAISIGGVTYSEYRMILLALAIVLGGGMLFLFHGTQLGLAARAVIMNEGLAQALGINTRFVRFFTFCAGAALATMAGALITPLVSIEPDMGLPWLINAFMLVLVAGTSVISLGWATLTLGGAQVLVSSFINPILGGLTIVVLSVFVLRARKRL
jgi:branched-subunit amino acid ABC-type transport system permease component